ncbi:MAG: DinB family protein [bacterium]
MNLSDQIRSLENSGDAIHDLLAATTTKQARWKPSPEKWSLLEILCHLVDEERDDFRHRVSSTLADPGREWPPIDPEGWARDRNYNDRDFQEALTAFRQERTESLVWLGDLGDVDWDRAYRHPLLNELRAGDLLAAWVTHDILHLRQLTSVLLAYVEQQAAPYSTRYALP